MTTEISFIKNASSFKTILLYNYLELVRRTDTLACEMGRKCALIVVCVR